MVDRIKRIVITACAGWIDKRAVGCKASVSGYRT